MTSFVRLVINGKEIEVPEGTTILKACQSEQIEIPVFCYHQRLSVAGNCRMCLVEVEKNPKPVASCSMPVSHGMVVHTHSDMVQKARNGVLEFLLINHPLDCPICDQAGECDLQDITYNYSRGESRFQLNKRLVPEKYMGPLIKTVMTRCIHCTRCIRFAEQVAGIPEIGTLHRGEKTEITTLEQAVTSELSGNLIDICPVGALNSRPYVFSGRHWEMIKTETIDVLDGLGSHIRVDALKNKVMRILPRTCEEINEEWLSDKSRFAYDGLSYQRIDRPYCRMNGKLAPCSFETAFQQIRDALDKCAPTEIAAIAGDLVDVSGLFALKMLLDSLQVPHYDCRQDGANYNATHRSHYLFNSSIQGVDQMDWVLMIGTNPRLEAPVLNARFLKRFQSKNCDFGLIGAPFDLTYPYTHVGSHLEILNNNTLFSCPFFEQLKDKKFPAVILGQACFTHPDIQKLLFWVDCLFQKHPAFHQTLDNQVLWNGFNVLHTCAGRVGGLDIEFVPKDGGWSTQEILNAYHDQKIKVLFLYGADEISFKKQDNTVVVYIGHHGDYGAQQADIVLPSASYVEKETFYVNTEGRSQQTKIAVSPPGDAREDWVIFKALSNHLNTPLPFNSFFELKTTLFATYPFLDPTKDFSPLPFCKHDIQPHSNLSFSKTPFDYPIKNYYMTCPISRHSVTMAQCVEQILKRKPVDAASTLA